MNGKTLVRLFQSLDHDHVDEIIIQVGDVRLQRYLSCHRKAHDEDQRQHTVYAETWAKMLEGSLWIGPLGLYVDCFNRTQALQAGNGSTAAR